MEQLQVIEQRLVNFNGSELMAAKTDDNKIYAAVKWVCDGMGLTENQRRAQYVKVNEDVVLSKGVKKITLLTNGGMQESICIELDYLPLWLAKINAGIIEDTAIQSKVVEYQIKAKDVLATAFIKQTPTSMEDAIIYSMNELKQVKERQILQDERQSFYEMELHKMKLVVDQEVWLTEHQKQQLKDCVGRRVYELKSDGYDTSFQAIYGALKRHFGVSKYDKIPRKEFNTAIRFVNGWYPVVKTNVLFDEVSL